MRQKRFLSWLLTLCLLLGMFSFPAYAEGNTTMISGDGTADKTGTMTITLVIPKKTPAATDLTYTAPTNLVYDGNNKAATVAAASGVTGLGPITVKYYSDASRSTEVTETKNVGTYYVGATVAEGDQYAASTAVLYGDGWTFTITASTPSAPAAPTKASATKNSITLNAVSGCEYSKDGANWQSGTEFTGLLPGTEYTFYQRVKATANTNASAASSAKFSTEADTYAMTITLVIKPAQTITASDVTATYGDTDKSVSASVTEPTMGGGAITYTVKDGSGDYIDVAADGKLTIKAVPPTDGKAYVIVTAEGTDDYAETTKEVAVTISKATVTVAAENQSIYVNGTVPDLSAPVLDTHYTVTGLVGEETLTTAPTLAYQKNGEAATPDSATAGTYDIVPSGAAASDNYAISYTNGTLTISNKGTQTISAENVTATYGDTDKSVSATVTDPATGGGDISYAVKEGSGDYIEINASTGALTIKAVPADGKAYVIVTAAETSTYTQATKEVTVTINKANAVAATVTANNRTYDGTEKPLVTVTGTPTGGEMQYAIGTATEATQPYTTSIPTGTEAGTYYVWYKVVGDANHLDSKAEGPVQVGIAQKSIAAAAVTLSATSLPYTGSQQTVTVSSVMLGATTLTANDYDVSGGTAGTDKGTYTVTVTGKGNYKDTASAGWSIGLATPSIAAVPAASAITEGQMLSDSTLTGGSATLEGKPVAGTFAWKNPETKPSVSDSQVTGYDVIFTPADQNNYATAACKVTLTVNPGDTQVPDPAPAEQPQTEAPAASPTEQPQTEAPATPPAEQPQTEAPAAPPAEQPQTEAPAAAPAADPALELLSGFMVVCRGSKIYVSYGLVSGADSYDIYAGYCGGKKLEKVMTVTGSSAVISKLNGKKPDMTRSFEVYVAAMAGGRRIARTFTAHVAGRKHDTYTNVKKVRPEKPKLKLQAGKSRKLEAKVILENPGKKEISHRVHKTHRFHFYSTDQTVATVSRNGRVYAVGAGECRILVSAMNGRSAWVKVSVR